MAIIENQNSRYIDDNATATDQLNRLGFAEALASLIVNAPDASSFRLGIYGGWGEGKSSVLYMMQKTLEESAVVCVPFVPWLSKTTEELLDDLLFAVVDALELEVGEEIKRQEKGHRNAQTLSNLVGLGKELNPIVKVASAAIDKAVGASNSRLQEWKDKALLDAVTNELTKRKVTVFVDDLDRVKPELLPDLLLNLRSILDLPNLFYVLALSPQIVQEGLEEVHPGWDDPLRFLEKIVEYPVFLPKPTGDEIRQFTRLNIQALNDVIDAQALDGLGNLLPRNPRQVKLFLRYLASLQGQLQRFRSDEISLYTLYLCQLIRMEFPNEVQLILEDEKTLTDISYNLYDSNHRKDSKGADAQQRPEAKYAPQDKEGRDRLADRERFANLFTALRTTSPAVGGYTLRDLFLLLDRPPILTWKELDALRDDFEKSSGEEKAELIREWLEKHGPPTPIRVSSLFARAIGSREYAISQLIGLDTQKEMKEALSQVEMTTDFLRFLTSDMELVRKGLILSSVWRDFLQHLLQYSHWNRPKEIYAPLRVSEIELFYLSVDRISEEMQEEIYPSIRITSGLGTKRHPLFDTVSPKFQRAAADVTKSMGRQIAERMLYRFEQADGLKPIWRLDASHIHKYFLFDPNSPFHSTEFRTRVVKLAEQAGNSDVLQKNFLEYFEMLATGATAGWGSFPPDCGKILQNSRYIKKIWSAALSHPLNPRNVGSLRNTRDMLMEKLNIPKTSFPTPRWWLKVEKEFFPQAS